jgi:hypothetical protein
LPPGQIIDIPYLKQLDTRVVVPIAYCQKGDIDKVTNFVPWYLARVTRRLWKLYDEEDYVIDTFSWDEGKNTLLDIFGTSIQHPKEHFVQYFGGTPALLIEKGSPRRSPRKNPTETDNEDGRGRSSLESPWHIDSTLEDTPSLAAGNIIYDPLNAQKSNNQKNPRKAIPPQLPPVLVIEKGSPRHSSRKNPSETEYENGRTTFIWCNRKVSMDTQETI